MHESVGDLIHLPDRAEAIFFDLAGTLIHVRDGLGRQYATVAREFGVEADPRDIERAFSPAFSAAGRMVFSTPDSARVAALEKKFWRDVVRGVFSQLGSTARFGSRFDAYFEQLFEHFATAGAWSVFPDVVPAIQRLRRAGLVVGLITNFDHRVFRVVEALGLARLVDSITIPALAGAAKPEPAIFQHALRTHGVNPAGALQVGDSIADDVEGARAAGLKGVLIDRNDRHDEAAVVRITSLSELPPLLGLD